MTKLIAKCPTCRKRPNLCICYEYRLELDLYDNYAGRVYVDNIATEPTKGQEKTWQPRANAKEWLRPTFIDGYGPILYIETGDGSLGRLAEVEQAIDDDTFNVSQYREREGYRVATPNKEIVRRFVFLRRPEPRGKPDRG